jgi:beta-glucosidase
VESADLSEQRIDESVYRLLLEQFRLGLFDDPYVDADIAASIVGRSEFRERAMEAQRKSIVLLKNSNGLLPLARQTADGMPRVYVIGMNPDIVSSYGYAVFSGESESTSTAPIVPGDMDYALIRVRVTNPITDIVGDSLEPPPQQTRFGGAMREELDLLAFSDMARSRSWVVTPSVEEIARVMTEVGAENTVLSIYFRQPFVLDRDSGFLDAGAIVALFGVSDEAVMDVLTGSYSPVGQLPFALADSAEAILRQTSDSPGYVDEDTLYPFGFGLSY